MGRRQITGNSEELSLAIGFLQRYYSLMLKEIDNRSIAFIGPEGSGKTTIAKRLCLEINKPYITTGDIIRDLATNDQGRLGNACRDMFSAHRYLDGQTLLEILANRLSQTDTAKGFVLDGGFRTIEETKQFKEMLVGIRRDFPLMVIHLRIPGWMSFDRLVWGPNARKREDDTASGVGSRLSKFYHQLGERVRVIESVPDWQLTHIDAISSIEHVYGEVTVRVGLS